MIVIQAAERLAEAERTIESIRAILIHERAPQFLTAFQTMLRCARELATEPERALDEMSRIYSSLQGGYGTFSDLVLWREDFAERKEVNTQFDELKSRLSQLFAAS